MYGTLCASDSRSPQRRCHRCSSLSFDCSNNVEPFPQNALNVLSRRLGKLIANAILHEAERAITKSQAFPEPFVRSHAPSALDLSASAIVHKTIIPFIPGALDLNE
jgi:hypothetical protein